MCLYPPDLFSQTFIVVRQRYQSCSNNSIGGTCEHTHKAALSHKEQKGKWRMWKHLNNLPGALIVFCFLDDRQLKRWRVSVNRLAHAPAVMTKSLLTPRACIRAPRRRYHSLFSVIKHNFTDSVRRECHLAARSRKETCRELQVASATDRG